MKLTKRLTALVLAMCIVLGVVPALAAPTFGAYSKVEDASIGINYICRAIATIEDNKPVAVTSVAAATGSIVQVIDVNSEKVLRSWTVPDGGTFWYGQIDPAKQVHLILGRSIYIYSPATKTLNRVSGDIPTSLSGTASGIAYAPSGYSYGVGGSVKDGYIRIFKYSPTVAISSVAQIPSISSSGGCAIVGNNLYTGGAYSGPYTTGTTALYKMDLSTNAVTAIDNPNGKIIKNVGYVTPCGNYVIAQLTDVDGNTVGHIYDTVNNKWMSQTVDYEANGMREAIGNEVYYSNGGTLHSINTGTLAITNYGFSVGSGYFRGNGRAFTCTKFGNKTCFIQAQYNGRIGVICPEAKETYFLSTQLISGPAQRRVTRVDLSGKVLVTAFMGSEGAEYDPIKDTKEMFYMGQGEGAVTYGSKTFFGNYPGGEIWCYDSSLPYVHNSNPYKFFDLPNTQDRPFAMDIMNGKLLIGSLPAANQVGAYFDIIDIATKAHESYPLSTFGTDLADQSPLSITHDDTYAYIATTTSSGGNTTSTDTCAYIVRFNMGTKRAAGAIAMNSATLGHDVKAIHGIRISPDNGMLYGHTPGIDFIINTSTWALGKKSVYDSTIIETKNGQIWHEQYMQFYGGYLFIGNRIIDPSTLSRVSYHSIGHQFSGINNGKAYFVDEYTNIYSTPISTSDTMTTGINNKWDDFETNESTFRIEGGVPVDATAGKTLSMNDTALKINAGYGEGKNPNQALKTAPGVVFQPNKTIANSAVFVAGLDFYVGSEDVEATLLAPVGSTNGEYQVPVYLEKGGKIYVTGKYDRRYDIGTVEIGKWNKLAVKYTVNTGNGASAMVYLNGAHVPAWDTYELKYYDGVHSYNKAMQTFKEFDVRVAARTSDGAYTIDKTYSGRNEYLLIDNVFLTSDQSVLNYPAMITNVEAVSSKQLKVTFNKEYTTSLAGTAIKNAAGSTVTTVSSSAASGKTATLTLAAALTPGQVYSIQPTGFSEAATFKTAINYVANFNGTGLTNTANGDTLSYTLARASTVSNNLMAMWSGYGNVSTYTNENADHNHGEVVDINLPSAVSNDTVVVSFDYMREFDTVTRISPRFANQQRYTFAPSLDIDKNGNVKTASVSEGDTVIGNVGSYEWHKIALKYTLSSANSIQMTVYIDGVNKGTYSNPGAEYKAAMTGIRFYNTAYTSEEGAAISATRADSRPERSYVDNMVITNNTSVIDLGVVFTNIEATTRNTILFTANKAVTAPVVDDIAIEGLTVSAVTQKGTNAFEVTVSEAMGVNAEYVYDIYVGDYNPVGTFTAKIAKIVEYFDAGNQGFAESAGWSHQQTNRDGKFQYSGDKAFGFSPHQKNAVGSGYANIKKDSGQIVWLTAAQNYMNDKVVISADFARGSERVGFWPLAVVTGAYRDPIKSIEITPTGEFKVEGTTYATGIKPLEWHNITIHAMVTSYATVLDIYFDGQLKVNNLKVARTDGFHTLKTIGEFETLTDSTLTGYYNTDARRNDIIMIDNFYIGKDLNYKTSDIVLSPNSDGVRANIYTGAVSRDNPGITAVYDSTGALKDVKITRVRFEAFKGSSIGDVFTTGAEKTGDTVKFFIVNDLLKLKPISNVLTK